MNLLKIAVLVPALAVSCTCALIGAGCLVGMVVVGKVVQALDLA